MSDKTKIINYTARDFDSIKGSLVEYIKRYYPDRYADFNQAGFGSILFDTVSYVGDILSFYLDYQANESMLPTAIEKNNVVELARNQGYKYKPYSTAVGKCAFYIEVPALDTEIPDSSYVPLLVKGTKLVSDANNGFILNEDVDFSNSDAEIRVGKTDTNTGAVLTYIYKKYANVISGNISQETITVGDYKRFFKYTLASTKVVEILSLTDADGNEYFEVENLSQNVIYKYLPNNNSADGTAGFILKPVVVPRRFTTEVNANNQITLQFGYGSEDGLSINEFSDPSNVMVQEYGRDYITETTFDPNKLLKTDKFGISPANTVLTVVYRENDSTNINAPVNTINQVRNFNMIFPTSATNSTTKNSVFSSLEVSNEEPILGDVTVPSIEEIKIAAYDNFSSQNRAVTQSDYEAIAYRMPSKLGSLKRVSITQDPDSFKRNLNMYVISEDRTGNLIQSNDSIKNNLKTWLLQYKMVNDTIDILDANIVNIGVDFDIISSKDRNKFDVLAECLDKLKKEVFNRKFEIGENFNYSTIYNTLNKLDGVIDVVNVKIRLISSANYSQIPFDIAQNTSADGRYVKCPESYIFEIKDLDTDIRGTVK